MSGFFLLKEIHSSNILHFLWYSRFVIDDQVLKCVKKKDFSYARTTVDFHDL